MRDVVLGRNAQIWQAIAREPGIADRVRHTLGHAELDQFEFTAQDRVWVFSYSRTPEDNTRLLQRLASAGVGEVVYITSSSTITAQLTRCYAYPRAKKLAEDAASALPMGKVLVLGLVVPDDSALPAGDNVATTFSDMARFMLAPDWPDHGGRRKALLRQVKRPFRGRTEAALYRLYGGLMRLAGSHPCVLRPIDLLLRVLGMRWYGYTYLSNQLWTRSMTS